MRHLPISSLTYLSCSLWCFESGKHWSYEHIRSLSKDTGVWEVWFGNVISFKSSGDPKVRRDFYFWTWKIILLDGCLTWLGAFTSCLFAWNSSSPTQGLGLPQALLPGCFCLWGTARPQKPRSPWSDGSVFSPSFLNLTPPSASNRTAFSFGLLAPKTAGSKASLVILGIFHVHCFQVITFCLSSHGQFKSRFNTRSDIGLFLEILLPPPPPVSLLEHLMATRAFRVNLMRRHVSSPSDYCILAKSTCQNSLTTPSCSHPWTLYFSHRPDQE